MNTNTTTDPKFLTVTKLANADDWAGLLRHWMAFQYQSSLESAMDLVRKHLNPSAKGSPRHKGDSHQDYDRWKHLLSILEMLHKGNISRELSSDWELFLWTEAEQLTLTIIEPYLSAFLCEDAKQAHLSQQERLLIFGRINAERGYVLAKQMDDLGIQALFLSLIARGNHNLFELERAGRSTKGRSSSVPYVNDMEALESLGLLGVTNDLQVARICYEKALKIYIELDSKQPGLCSPTIAERFNNLGYVQLDLNNQEGACASFTKALQIYRRLSVSQPDIYRKSLAATLNNLGSVPSFDHQAAHACFSEALQLYRILESDDPGYYRPLIESMEKATADSELSISYTKRPTNTEDENQVTRTYWFTQGLSLDNAERWADAIICYERTLEIDRNFVAAWSHKGNSLLQMRVFDEALRCFEKAIELDSKYAQAWVGKGDALSNSLIDQKGGMLIDLSNKKDILNKIDILKEAIESYNNFIAYATADLTIAVPNIKSRRQELEGAIEFFKKYT